MGRDKMKYPKIWIVVLIALLVGAALAGWLAPADVRLMLACIAFGVMIGIILVMLIER